jgi:hypothetical protein
MARTLTGTVRTDADLEIAVGRVHFRAKGVAATNGVTVYGPLGSDAAISNSLIIGTPIVGGQKFRFEVYATIGGEDVEALHPFDAFVPAGDTEISFADLYRTRFATPPAGVTLAEAIQTEIENHTADPDPHPEYTTDAEVQALIDAALEGLPGGDMTKAVYDPDNNGVVNRASEADEARAGGALRTELDTLRTDVDAKATSAALTAEQAARILADQELQDAIAALAISSGAWLALDTHTDRTNATETTADFVAWLAEQQTSGKPGFIPAGDYLLNPVTVSNWQPTIFGAGERRARLWANGSGALLTVDAAISSSTGLGPRLSNFGLYSDRATTADGDIGLLITNAGGNASSAFPWADYLVVSGFHDNIVLRNCYFGSIRNCYLDNYRRFGIRISCTYSVDSGDHKIEGCEIQPIQNQSGTGYDAGGCNIRLEQFSGTRVLNNKIFPGHAVGIHVHPNASYATEAFPTGMCIIGFNQFDSFGSSGTAVKLEGTWDTGGQHGNKVSNVQIIANNLSNVGKLLVVAGKSVTTVLVSGNLAKAGGGIEQLVGSVLNGMHVVGNFFDNRAETTSVGAAGSGYGPASPWKMNGTHSEVSGAGNKWLGFTAASDIEDSGGGGGSSFTPQEELTQLTPASNVVTVPGNSGVFSNTYSVAADAQEIKLPNVDGAFGIHQIRYSGTPPTPTISAASGAVLVHPKQDDGTTAGAGLPASADDLLVRVHWSVQGAHIFYVLENCGVIAGLTTEGGGGGGAMDFSSLSLAPALLLQADQGIYDAVSGGSPVTADGATVARWEDQSGNGRHVTQATAGNRPVYKTGLQNGKAGLRFSISTATIIAGSYGGGGYSGPVTAFVVAKNRTPASGTWDFALFASSTYFSTHPAGGGTFYYHGGSTGLAGPAADSAFHLHAARLRDSSAGQSNYRVDAGTNSTQNITDTIGLNALNIGGVGASDRHGDFDILAIVLFAGHLSDADFDTARGIINTYYSIY